MARLGRAFPAPPVIGRRIVATVLGTLTSSALKNNTGTLLASESGMTVYANLASTNALAATLTGQTTSGAAVWVGSDAAITAGTSYRVIYKLASGAEGMETLTAT